MILGQLFNFLRENRFYLIFFTKFTDWRVKLSPHPQETLKSRRLYKLKFIGCRDGDGLSKAWNVWWKEKRSFEWIKSPCNIKIKLKETRIKSLQKEIWQDRGFVFLIYICRFYKQIWRIWANDINVQLIQHTGIWEIFNLLVIKDSKLK